MARNFGNFLRDLYSRYCPYILIKFSSDRMSPRDCAKNRQNDAQGLNCNFFVDSDIIFEIHAKDYHIKKFLYISDNFEIFVIF